MSQPDLIRRQLATQATLGKFRGKRFGWAEGHHCGMLVYFHLKRMGIDPGPRPRLKSLIGAKADIRRRCGGETIADVMDALHLPRIAPAAMLLGDIGFRASEDGLGGILVCAGPNKLIGWFTQNEETEGRLCVMDMTFDQVEAAWRL